MEWIPVSEELPEMFECHDDIEDVTWMESDIVLVATRDYSGEYEIHTAVLENGNWDINGIHEGTVTHWQELPETPGDDEAEGIPIYGDCDTLYMSEDRRLMVVEELVGYELNTVNEDGAYNYIPVRIFTTDKDEEARNFLDGKDNKGTPVMLIGMKGG